MCRFIFLPPPGFIISKWVGPSKLPLFVLWVMEGQMTTVGELSRLEATVQGLWAGTCDRNCQTDARLWLKYRPLIHWVPSSSSDTRRIFPYLFSSAVSSHTSPNGMWSISSISIWFQWPKFKWFKSFQIETFGFPCFFWACRSGLFYQSVVRLAQYCLIYWFSMYYW